MVPKGWTRLPIQDVCETIVDCVNKTAPTVDYETPFKMIRTSNVRDGRVITTDVRYVSKDVFDTWTRRGPIKDGDLIFTREAPVGEIGLLEEADGFFLGQRTMLYRANETTSHNRYLLYTLQSHYCRKQIDDYSNGGTVAHMRVPDCGAIIINVPPIAEQRKIAQILSTWDKAIATTERLLANKQQQKKALMQRLLTGKQRFAGFEGEWKTVKFEDVLKIEIGGTPSRAKPEYWDEQKVTNNRWLSIANLQGSRIFDTSEYISDLGISNSNVALIPRGTIVMSFKLTIGRRAILMNDCYTNEAICALIIKDRAVVSNDFLYQAIELVDFESEIDQAVKGKTLNKEKLKRLKLLLPNIEEQHKIASTLSVADAEITTIQNQRDNLKLQKKALMQQLLTGKRRVKVDEAAA